MSAGEAAARTTAVRAALTIGPVETEYLRVGAGAAVVVLAPGLAGAVQQGEVPAAWQGRRLIVPLRTTIAALATHDGAPSPLAAWLRGLLDGLGIGAVTLVVPPPLEGEVRRFAASHPGEVERVVVAP